jgi:MFS superfamily sulfate permease-like transporter
MHASYKISWLRRDMVAGIVLTTLLVPQGMAYAELAGLPPITGLSTIRHMQIIVNVQLADR